MKSRLGKFLLLNVIPPLAAGFIRLLRRLLRVEVIGAETVDGFSAKGEHVILSFWHDQLLLMVTGYRGAGARILISPSQDGELIARTMGYFGQGAVRGSSSRGGRAAFKELLQLAAEPYDLVFTPDGPKGPRHQLKPGVAQLARLSGRPVIPMAFACSRGYRFASWDRFLLPYPLARGVFAFGAPLYCSKGEDAEVFAQQLQAAMAATNQTARQRLEDRGVSAV
ncbi:MAG: lysophospholipid acyltransferase family protein [Trichloromonadaceae bacterium]